MPGEVRYSLFPLSDDQLQRQPSRRASSRPRTADTRPTNSLSVPKEQVPVANSATASLVAGASTISRPNTSHSARPGQESLDRKVPDEPKVQKSSQVAPAGAEQPTSKVQPSLLPSTAHVDHADTAPKASLSRTPSAAGILPSAYKLDTSTRAPIQPTSKPVAYDFQYKHTRNLTNGTSASSATATTKPSPITPDTIASSSSLFSPITPADSTTTSPVKYPTVPRLSSSPPPMSFASWSPPRRSNTRTTNTSQSTISSRAPSHHTHTHTSSSATASRIPANLQRSTSRATNITQSSNTAPPAPFVSIFPTFNEDVPLGEQDYLPNDGYWHSNEGPPVRGPVHRTMSSETSSSALSEANLAKLDSAYAGQSASNPSKSRGSATLTGGDGISPSEKRKCVLVDEPETLDLPLRSHPLPQPAQPTANATTPKQQPAPFFPPPPRPTRAPSKKRSKSTPAPKKIQKTPPKASSGLFGRHKPAAASQTRELDFSWTGSTSVKASFDEKRGALTMKTTTVALVPPGHALRDTAKAGMEETEKPDQPTVLNLLSARPGIKMGGKAGDDEAGKVQKNETKELSRVGPGGVAQLSPEDAEWGDQAVQHSVSVALGAVAFVMGVGVEVAGGMVGGLRRKKGGKEKA